MARISGKNGRVLMDQTGAVPGTPVQVAAITSFTINLTTERFDVTAMGDTNRQYVTGLPDYQGDFNATYDTADLNVIESALAGTPVTLKLIPDNSVPGTFFSGKAYLDTSVEVPVGGAATMTGTWAAAGPWALTQTP